MSKEEVDRLHEMTDDPHFYLKFGWKTEERERLADQFDPEDRYTGPLEQGPSEDVNMQQDLVQDAVKQSVARTEDYTREVLEQAGCNHPERLSEPELLAPADPDSRQINEHMADFITNRNTQ